MEPSQRSLPRNLRGPSLLPGLHPLLPALDLVKSRKRDYSWDPSSLTHELWAGAFPGASLGKQRAKPHPGSLPQPPSLGLQWLLVLANNVRPSSFLLRKPLLGRGDIGAECSLGQTVGDMAGWPALFLEKLRARAKQSRGICWRPPRKASSESPVSHLRSYTGGEMACMFLMLTALRHLPNTPPIQGLVGKEEMQIARSAQSATPWKM